MQLDVIQNRIVKGKPLKVSLVKGADNTGKTTTAVYRTHYLKNNYCLFEDEKILILTKDSIARERIRNIYNKIEEDTKFDYKTLFSNGVDRVHILAVDEIINRYYFEYTNSEKKWYKIIQEAGEKAPIIEQCLKEITAKYKGLRLLNDSYINFFIEEIQWMKACGYREEETYQTCERIGRRYKKGQGPARLLKNSREREAMFEIYKIYNSYLNQKGTIDNEDISYLALVQAQRLRLNEYTHIIVDEGQNLNKTQLNFINKLLKESSYSSTTFFINKSQDLDCKCWFVKNRRNKDLQFNYTAKTYNLSKCYIQSQNKAAAEDEKIMDLNNIKSSSMENYEYIDLRHHRKYEFKIDSDSKKEVIVGEDRDEQIYEEKELAQLSVYSDIAAGEPIMMHAEQDAEFYLPRYWINTSTQCFILKIKGDSMIGANIFNEDYVVVKKQSTAQHGDIVAADLEGSATLKRLSLNKSSAALMPENDKYSPIFLHDRQVSILGVVVGIIKSKN